MRAVLSPKWSLFEAVLVATGFGLIGVSYGLVRFAYGQFLPQMQADLGLSDAQAGVISSGVFFGSCLALVVAAWMVRRFGARLVAGLSGVLATFGLILVASASDPMVLSAGLLIAGMSTGLSMPPLVEALYRGIAPSRQNTAQAVVNSGSSGGLLIAGPVALWMSSAWQEAYIGFAVLAALFTLLVFCTVPRGRPVHAVAAPLTLSPALMRVLAAAFALGAVSVAIWTFGGVVLKDVGGWSDRGLSIFWMVTGISGLLGAGAGYLVRLHGAGAVYRGGVCALGIALAAMAYTHADPVFAFVAAILFGAAYVMISGVFVIEAIAALPSAPASGVAAAFFMIPAGQVAASPVFGMILEQGGAGAMVLSAIVLCALSVPLLNKPRDGTMALPI